MMRVPIRCMAFHRVRGASPTGLFSAAAGMSWMTLSLTKCALLSKACVGAKQHGLTSEPCAAAS